jgi:hypothetical protein
MTAITAHRPTSSDYWTQQCLPVTPRQQRGAERAARRYRRQKSRHDHAVHDDRYLDRSGFAITPTAAAFVWLR